MPRWLILTLMGLVALLLWLSTRGGPEPLAATTNGAMDACHALMVPGEMDDAMQTEQAAPPFRLGNATITPLAGFSVGARVLSREDYSFDRGARFSPLDLALGWGPMSQPGLADRLSVSQGGRWYHYRWGGNGPPLSPAQIALNSSNMHMVPADANIARELESVHAGDVVRLDGWLIGIDGDDGFRWRSSLSRDDVGAGACELVLVCAVGRR
jgi:hypothetical protein